MKVFVWFALACILILGSCSNEPSLQKFFVENAEKKDFVALDISSSILNIDESKLSVEQKKALTSFDKINIIAFKSTPQNQATYEAEKLKLNGILKNEAYQQLIKVGSGKDGASVSFVGTDDNIKEFIFYANRKEYGFAVVRVTGDSMSPTNVVTLLTVFQKLKINLDQLKPLESLITQ